VGAYAESNGHLPETADQIDQAWLTDALAARYAGVKVAGVEVIERHELTNAHARLRVSYDEPAGAPSAMFGKLLPSDPGRRASIAQSGMGRLESMFYATLAQTVEMRVPQVYVTQHDDRDGSFLLLIEDLVATQCGVSDGTVSVPLDAAARALEDLAELHVRFEDPARRSAEAGWVPKPVAGGSYGVNLLREALEHHRDRLSTDFAGIAEMYINQGEALHALWQEGPTTVIHGDPHIGNLFDDDGRVGFLDWGLIRVSTPMRDVSYFLSMALSIDDRRQHEGELLRYYLDARTARGGLEIRFNEAWLAHRLHAGYLVPACCQIVTFPNNVTEGRRIFSDAFLARAEAAVADLEAGAALHEVAGR
jgi:hypothetical protein